MLVQKQLKAFGDFGNYGTMGESPYDADIAVIKARVAVLEKNLASQSAIYNSEIRLYPSASSLSAKAAAALKAMDIIYIELTPLKVKLPVLITMKTSYEAREAEMLRLQQETLKAQQSTETATQELQMTIENLNMKLRSSQSMNDSLLQQIETYKAQSKMYLDELTDVNEKADEVLKLRLDKDMAINELEEFKIKLQDIVLQHNDLANSHAKLMETYNELEMRSSASDKIINENNKTIADLNNEIKILNDNIMILTGSDEEKHAIEAKKTTSPIAKALIGAGLVGAGAYAYTQLG